MNDQKQGNQKKEEAPNSMQGAPYTPSGWRKLLARKWVFPATYMAAAAIILTLMWVYQDAGKNSVSEVDLGLKVSNEKQESQLPTPDAVEVTAPVETMQWPVVNRNEVKVSLPFYDSQASNEVRQAAMIEYGDTLTPHVGIDFKKEDGSAFDVVAAMSGKVTLVEKNPVVGHQVEITHSNGMVTVYQSLAEVKVVKDAEVKKGDIIAKAGRNELEKDEGVHLHFEVRQGAGGAVINPQQILNIQ